MSKTVPTQPPTFVASLRELSAVLAASDALAPTVAAVAECLLESLQQGGKILTCGNGGSAADALHMAQEFVGRYQRERRALPAICLAADTTSLTCIGNDYGYDRVFARGVEAFGKKGDVLVAFSTSGNSPNVLSAFASARRLGVITVLVSGKDGGKAVGQCDHALVVPSKKIARIQEVHTLILHQWLEAIDAHEWD